MHKWKKITAWCLPTSLFLVLGYIAWNHLPEIASEIARNPAPLFYSVGFSLLNAFGGLLAWHVTVHEGKGGGTLLDSYRIYVGSLLAKYLPLGKVLQFVPLLSGGGDQSEKTNLAYSFFVSNLIGSLIGVAIVILGAGFWLSNLDSYATNIKVVGIALLVGLLASRPIVRFAMKRIGWAQESLTRFSALGIAKIGLLHFVLGWLAEGMAIVMLAEGAGHSVSLSDFIHFMTAYAIASLGGYLAIFTPGGIGVREALFVVLLQPRISPAMASYLALTLRLSNVTGDLLFGVLLAPNQIRRILKPERI